MKGEISAKQVTIVGRVTGNVTAIERVEICDSGRLEGDIQSARLLVQEGAVLNGSVQMQAGAAGARPEPKAQPSQPQARPAQQQVG